MNLRELRKQAGLSQHDVGKRLNVNQAAVSNWERGANAPLRKYHDRLAYLYGVDTEDIVSAAKQSMEERTVKTNGMEERTVKTNGMEESNERTESI